MINPFLIGGLIIIIVLIFVKIIERKILKERGVKDD